MNDVHFFGLPNFRSTMKNLQTVNIQRLVHVKNWKNQRISSSDRELNALPLFIASQQTVFKCKAQHKECTV
jgi:hypothetical protein